MQKQNMRETFIKVVIVSFIAILILFDGCSGYKISNINNDNKTLSVNKGLGKFSFEYNTKFQISSVDIWKDNTDIFLDGPVTDKIEDITFISINVRKLEIGESDYKNSHFGSLEFDAGLTGFKLIEQFPLKVNGEDAEEFAYYYIKDRPNEQKMEGLLPVPSIARELIFVHDNLVWSVEIHSLESTATIDKADFDHIVQTFKILD